METLEGYSGTPTTFQIEREENRMENLIQPDISAVVDRTENSRYHRRGFLKRNTGLYSTFILIDDCTDHPSVLGEDSVLNYDVITPLKVNKRVKVKVRIKSVNRHQPRIFFDE